MVTQYLATPVPADGEDARLREVLAWATARLDRSPSVEAMAARAAMSPRTFTRRFKEATGATPHAWLRHRRLDRAEHLLETTGLSIEEVARRAGYASATVLREQFTRRRGMPPRAYRQGFAGNPRDLSAEPVVRPGAAGHASTMTDTPLARTAIYTVLHEGYGSPGVAATVGLVRDGAVVLVTDPGMVRDRALILDPLRAAGVAPEEVTDVVFSHHHPDHTLNAALFPNARFHDHWAIYQGDTWDDREAEGYELSPSIRLIRTPGHTREDITTLVGTQDGVVAFTHAWNRSTSVGDDVAYDRAALSDARRRVVALADVVVPGHGPAFVPDDSTPL